MFQSMRIKLKNYIDHSGSGYTQRKASPNVAQHRYNLLMSVRGSFYNTWTGVYKAVNSNDLESITYMLDGLTSAQKCDILKIQTGYGSTPLHTAASYGNLPIITYLMKGLSRQQRCELIRIGDNIYQTALHKAAYYGYSDIITILMTDLAQEQKFDLLIMQDNYGCTALHKAASAKRGETVQAILDSVLSGLQIQLLCITNFKNKSPTDVDSGLQAKLSLLLSQGIGLLSIIQTLM